MERTNIWERHRWEKKIQSSSRMKKGKRDEFRMTEPTLGRVAGRTLGRGIKRKKRKEKNRVAAVMEKGKRDQALEGETPHWALVSIRENTGERKGER